jgi:phosphoglycolate phosphatase-like HAD superfamily hydrolase
MAPLATVVLPGVVSLIEGLSSCANVFLGLVTGNIAEGARLKLAPDGLRHHFRLGAFGCDHADRSELIRIAWERAHQSGFGPFSARRVVYIGDTERDIGAGLSAGVVTFGVATGPLSVEALYHAGAHRVYSQLPDATTFLREVLECAI